MEKLREADLFSEAMAWNDGRMKCFERCLQESMAAHGFDPADYQAQKELFGEAFDPQRYMAEQQLILAASKEPWFDRKDLLLQRTLHGADFRLEDYLRSRAGLTGKDAWREPLPRRGGKAKH
jgi:hypothetical protein